MAELLNKDIYAEVKSALEKAQFPFFISGAVAFGSRAKGTETAYSDIDLLIVANGINPKRHRRGTEIVLIKRCLPALPFDILLLTRDEVVSNFKNHNPLFLDIAEEGLIILDRDGFLNGLIAETKEYIGQRGIKKIKNGWEFRVKKGVPTLLSRISNKDFSAAMLTDGQRDFDIGKKLIESGFYDKAVYHFQQAIEKSIKSVLIAMGVFQKTHFVGEVLRITVHEKNIADEWKKRLLEIAEISEGVEPEVSLSRYPGIINDTLWLPSGEYERMDAEETMKKAGKVLQVSKEFTDDWFFPGYSAEDGS